ncbi:hypothetical protein PMIN03_003332 [Paraphaeosphaeria minitans]
MGRRTQVLARGQDAQDAQDAQLHGPASIDSILLPRFAYLSLPPSTRANLFDTRGGLLAKAYNDSPFWRRQHHSIPADLAGSFFCFSIFDAAVRESPSVVLLFPMRRE